MLPIPNIDNSPLAVNAEVIEDTIRVKCSGCLSGFIHYTKAGHVKLIECLGNPLSEALMYRLSDYLRIFLSDLVGNWLYVYIDQDHLTASFDTIKYDDAKVKARFVAEDEVDGNSENLMNLLIFIHFIRH